MNDGGPAFPKAATVETEICHTGDYPRVLEGQEGMSLRDYFAAKALQSIIADPDYVQASMLDMAITAYRYADAMLEARQ